MKRARFLVVAIAAAGMAAGVFSASAQEISESHLKAARQAIAAIGATNDFDGILPQAAAALKQQLIQKNPDQVELITATVDEETLELASRRADLEREAATIYAKVFTEEELAGIAAFYESAAGRKLLSDGPIVTRELNQAAEIWQRGIGRDLSINVGEQIESVLQSQAPATPAPVTPEPEGGEEANQ